MPTSLLPRPSEARRALLREGPRFEPVAPDDGVDPAWACPLRLEDGWAVLVFEHAHRATGALAWVREFTTIRFPCGPHLYADAEGNPTGAPVLRVAPSRRPRFLRLHLLDEGAPRFAREEPSVVRAHTVLEGEHVWLLHAWPDAWVYEAFERRLAWLGHTEDDAEAPPAWRETAREARDVMRWLGEERPAGT